MSRRSILLLGLAGVLVGGGVVAAVFLFTGDDDREPVAAAIPSTSVQGSTTSTSSGNTSSVPTTTIALADLTAADIGRDFGDAVWRVDVEGCGLAGSGSSFSISPTHLITNHHVVEFDSSPQLMSRSGVVLNGRVLGSSPVPDVAVIEVTGAVGPALDWAVSSTVSLGDPIVTLGYPAPDGDFTVTPGSVLSFGTEDGFGRFIRTDGQIDHGNSGGPALDSQGGVVGIVTSLEANPTGAQLVPQIFSSDVIRPVIEAMLEAPTYPEPFCEATGATPPITDYTDFWTVIVASLPVEEYTYDEAYGRALAFFDATGLWADVLLSDLYYSLNPGYWAVYTGAFLTQSEADSHCALVESYGYDCYSRQVSWYLGE